MAKISGTQLPAQWMHSTLEATPHHAGSTNQPDSRALQAKEDAKPASGNPGQGDEAATPNPEVPEGIDYTQHVTGVIGSERISEFSHQQIIPQPVKQERPATSHSEDVANDGGWQVMPAFATYDVYDEEEKLVARQYDPEADPLDTVPAKRGTGYTRVTDDDARSATSMDDNTQYLFQGKDIDASEDRNSHEGPDPDPVSQLKTTKNLLTDPQRVAYVSLCRLAIAAMSVELGAVQSTKKTKRELALAKENMKMWGQKMMVRIYAHMEIGQDEQLMIEQLTEHGLFASDLTSQLMQNARIRNTEYEQQDLQASIAPNDSRGSESSADATIDEVILQSSSPPGYSAEDLAWPPPYEHTGGDELEIKSPGMVLDSKTVDVDIRWTVLCDLFLLLIADGVYDARSRSLLEKVGFELQISWTDVCRFEKRVTDALEMQESMDREDLKETDNIEARKRYALRRRYVVMGLATVGGGLVIGLSAGLVAPLIGAGLAAGFSTIGVTGTGSFLGGTAAAALITTGGTVSGGIIGHKAGSRRTKEVTTFEYRPLHNNKRVNLVITVSGWLTGRVDDVRLPFSTVDPVMGDLFTVLYDPEMLQSMGQTIGILATEALTQSLQQVLGATILVGLMAALQVPILLSKLAYLIDNPWTVSCSRAWEAGLILADSLVARSLGNRPITLVGYSLGSRVIFSALKELASRGAFGVVQNVYLFGSPVVATHDEYLRIRAIVSGRFVNGYARNDWILAYLFRATSGGIWRVAGMAPVEAISGLENIDVTDMVEGHMAYRTAIPKLLKRVGWLTTSDTFAEIDDPDPEAQRERQRELIDALAEARDQAEAGQKKKRFGIFSRAGKKNKKAAWETYDEHPDLPGAANGPGSPGSGKRAQKSATSPQGIKSPDNSNLLFDVEAIRSELAAESYENSDITVRQLHTTLPPLELDFGSHKELETTLPPLQLERRDSPPVATFKAQPSTIRASEPHFREMTVPPVNDEAPQTAESKETENGAIGFQSSSNAVGMRKDAESAGRAASTLRSPLAILHSFDLATERNAWADGSEDDASEVKLTFE